MPGRIRRIPGGVAMNIAMTLQKFGLTPALLSAVGQDAAGDDLIDQAHKMGLITKYIYRSETLPTDVYMAIEDANGLIAAIADAHSLEAVGDQILWPLEDGTLGSTKVPYQGIIALDGNLTEAQLRKIAEHPGFSKADLRVAPASPGKAKRLRTLLGHPNTTLYVNREEAGLLCNTSFTSATDAAAGLCASGAQRVLVTDGAGVAADGTKTRVLTNQPPDVTATRITGAGDTFLAAHIASEIQGRDANAALVHALAAAAAYVAGDEPHV